MNKSTLLLASFGLGITLLTACGKQDAPPAAAPVAAPAAAPVATPVTTPAPTPVPVTAPAETAAGSAVDGKSVFNKVCAMCHAIGAAGAPKPGDKADWAPRIAQGNDTLFKHALEGFNGAKGQMPARGANPKLTDDEVKAAVLYMAEKSR